MFLSDWGLCVSQNHISYLGEFTLNVLFEEMKKKGKGEKKEKDKERIENPQKHCPFMHLYVQLYFQH